MGFLDTFNRIKTGFAEQKKAIVGTPPVAPMQGPIQAPVQGPQQPPAPQGPQFLTQGGFSGVRPPVVAPAPQPLTPPPVSAGGPAPSPIFRGERGDTFVRSAGEFKRTSEGELQDMADRGTVQTKRATLINPATGERVAVDVGSQDAQARFGQGFVLEGQAPTAPLETPTVAPPGVPAAPEGIAPVSPLSEAEAQRDALRQQLLGSLLPGQGEADLQDRITTLLGQGDILGAESAARAAGLEGQGRGITRDIITGQQASERRLGLLEQQTTAAEALPLEQKLANLIAQRGQAQTAAEKQLEFLGEDITAQRETAAGEASQLQALALQAAQSGASSEEIAAIMGAGSFSAALGLASQFLTPAQEQQALETLSPGQSLFDPNTGELIFTAPGGKGDVAGVDEVISDTLAEKLDLPFGATRAEANQIISQRGGVLSDKQKAEVDKATIKAREFKSKFDLLDTIETSRGIDAVVGPNFAARSKFLSPISTFISGETGNFTSAVDSLIDKIALEKLIAIKGAGATLGALSDRELDVLRNSATKMNSWVKRKTDRKGNTVIVGINTTEEIFLEEIARIREETNVLNDENDLILSQGGGGVGDIAPDEMEELRQMFPGLSDQQIREQAGFSSDLGSSLNATGNITKLKVGTNSNVRVDSSIENKITQANAAMKAATGMDIQINQSFRSREQQAELFRRSQAGEIGRAAPPGKSFHEKGLAIDVTNWKEAEPFLRKLGFKNDLPNDRGHFSIGEFA